MRKKERLPGFAVLINFAIVFVFFASPAFAKTVSSTELIEKCQFYNGKEVIFQGEVIGDIMLRGENAWIYLNDDSYSSKGSEETPKLKGYNSGQSIWCKTSQIKSIKHKGDYNYIGDTVRVSGIFHRACPEHGGDMDIHAQKLTVVKAGYEVKHPLNVNKLSLAIFLSIISLLIGGLYLFTFKLRR